MLQFRRARKLSRPASSSSGRKASSKSKPASAKKKRTSAFNSRVCAPGVPCAKLQRRSFFQANCLKIPILLEVELLDQHHTHNQQRRREGDAHASHEDFHEELRNQGHGGRQIHQPMLDQRDNDAAFKNVRQQVEKDDVKSKIPAL